MYYKLYQSIVLSLFSRGQWAGQIEGLNVIFTPQGMQSPLVKTKAPVKGSFKCASGLYLCGKEGGVYLEKKNPCTQSYVQFKESVRNFIRDIREWKACFMALRQPSLPPSAPTKK